MKVPEGQTFHAAGGPYNAGDDIPEDLLARLPADHPFKQAPKPRPAPAPSSSKD